MLLPLTVDSSGETPLFTLCYERAGASLPSIAKLFIKQGMRVNVKATQGIYKDFTALQIIKLRTKELFHDQNDISKKQYLCYTNLLHVITEEVEDVIRQLSQESLPVNDIKLNNYQ